MRIIEIAYLALLHIQLLQFCKDKLQKELNKFMDLTPEEKEVLKQASAIEPKEHSKEAIKLADTMEELKQTLEDARTDDATAKLEERGEDVTPESIQKEIDNPKPKSLAEEL